MLAADPYRLGAQLRISRISDDGSVLAGGCVVAEIQSRTLQAGNGQYRHVSARIEVHDARLERFGIGRGDDRGGDPGDDVGVGHHALRRDDETRAFDDPAARVGAPDHLDDAGRSRSDLRVATQRRLRCADVANGLGHPGRNDLREPARGDDRFEGVAQSVGGNRHGTVDGLEDCRLADRGGSVRNR